MSSTTATLETRTSARFARLADFVELTKPRIAVMMLIAVGVSAFVARWGQPDPWQLLHTILGVALVACSASAVNQWIERESDSRMDRTARRPLPAGRISSRQALAFATVSLVVGTAYLYFKLGWEVASWSFATWAIYVLAYTPLKSRTAWNTFIGAISGALPVVIGWVAAGGAYDIRLAGLFLTLFLWQFPHFMAIAWLYRHQYSRAGLQMLTVVDPTGQRAGVQAVLCALALLPASLVPALHGPAPSAALYAALVLVLGVGQLVCAFVFFASRNESTARLLLRASLIYLPSLLGLLLFVPLA